MLAVLRLLPRDLAESLRFLTRLPLPGPPAMRNPGEALAAFPLAGLVLGLLLTRLDALLELTRFPPFTRDVLLVVALVLMTGGLHLDGLMDSCDGLFGGRDLEQRLSIMRDSRVGGFGVLGAVCALLLKLAFLVALPGDRRAAALIVAPVLGRWSLVLAATLFPPARPGGLGALFQRGLTPPRQVVASGAALLIVALAGGLPGVLAFLVVSGATWLIGHYVMGKIEGLTGDIYGAICELTEVAALFVLALLT